LGSHECSQLGFEILRYREKKPSAGEQQK